MGLYEGLNYKVFLDSEAKFKIHDLQLIVKNTEVFLFVLTHGILLSHWCRQELLCNGAFQKGKCCCAKYIDIVKIIVIRDLGYALPSTLPPAWSKVEHILHSPDQLIWMAEYNAACINALKKRIGVNDEFYRKAKSVWTMHQEQLKQGSLVLTGEILEKEDVLGLIDIVVHTFPSVLNISLANRLKSLMLY